MRCPKCGLVHSPGDQVCRRCQVDLKTGEPRPIQVSIPQDQASALNRMKARLRLPKSPAAIITRKAKKPGKKKNAAEAVQEKGETSSETFIAPRKKKKKKTKMPAPLLSLFSGRKGVSEIPCAQCGADMMIARTRPYSMSGPVALLALGAALLAAGVLFHLLFISSGIALAAGAFYLRAGRTFWKCPSCGFTVSREAG